MAAITKPASKSYLSKAEFLDMALQNIPRRGQSRLHMSALIEAMPVTSGSFYHHFKNKREFLFELIRHWDEVYTQAVIDILESRGAERSAKEKLWIVLNVIDERDLARYDHVIRSISVGDPELVKRVAAVDRKRMSTIRDLFAELGFTGDELEVRTRAFVTTVSQEHVISVAIPGPERADYLRSLLEFFTRP